MLSAHANRNALGEPEHKPPTLWNFLTSKTSQIAKKKLYFLPK